MNKKGFVIEILAFIIIGIMVILFFGTLIYAFNLINTEITNTDLDSENVNITKVTSPIFGGLNSGMNNLKIVAIVMLIGYIFATFITAYFSSKNQLWLIVYIFMSILLVIFSVYISNAYETLKTNATISSIVSGFGAADYIVLHLPVWVTVIALVGTTLSIVGVVASRRLNENM